jgi:LPPG:FO 2-phospho-L-lactate transferase
VKVVLFSGGVGGARFAAGVVDVVGEGLTVVGNVGDDLEVLGLHVSPDLDSVLYTLAGVGDQERGWGHADEAKHGSDSATVTSACTSCARRP